MSVLSLKWDTTVSNFGILSDFKRPSGTNYNKTHFTKTLQRTVSEGEEDMLKENLVDGGGWLCDTRRPSIGQDVEFEVTGQCYVCAGEQAVLHPHRTASQPRTRNVPHPYSAVTHAPAQNISDNTTMQRKQRKKKLKWDLAASVQTDFWPLTYFYWYFQKAPCEHTVWLKKHLCHQLWGDEPLTDLQLLAILMNYPAILLPELEVLNKFFPC